MSEKAIAFDKQLVNGKQLAAVLGISPRYVRMIVKSGEISQVDENTYELGASVQGFIRHHKSQVKKDTPEKLEQARLKKAQADKAELDFAVLNRDLLYADHVSRLIGPAVIAVRQALLAIPIRAAALCATMDGNEKKIHELLDSEVRQALAGLDFKEIMKLKPEKRGRGRPKISTD